MEKKYPKKIYFGIIFFALICAGFFYLSPNKISAAGLEVQYPVVAGQTLDTTTKLPDYIKYMFNVGMSLGFLAVFISLVIAGIMFFLSPVKADLLADAKDRVSGAISGLLILILTYLIITTINPQLNFFQLNQLPPAPPPPVAIQSSGVYFYTKPADCPTNPAQLTTTSSVSDLNDLKNKINVVNITQGEDSSYITILYDNINFWGKCFYINGNTPCQSATSPFAASASVYGFNPDPDGDGVYFYRKSFFNGQGGYLFISNDEIANAGNNDLYSKNLDQLKFTGDTYSDECNVPEEEQDCVKYDAKGKCSQKKCPTLAGENISSIKIHGNYLVLLAYSAPSDRAAGPWTSCQEFPTKNDVNRTGPRQIKWESIRNNGGVIPNYLLIIPIQ